MADTLLAQPLPMTEEIAWAPFIYPPPVQTFNLSAALVSAGTSRALILSGEELGEMPPELAVQTLMEGRGETGGLAGSHYQSNKVAVVWRAPFPTGFIFKFYQYDKDRGRVLADMECSNVTAGCAAYALTAGIAVMEQDGTMHALNSGTGQQSLLSPSSPANPWRTDWNIRFMQEDFTTASIPMESEMLPVPDGHGVEFWAFERGNVFVLSHINPGNAVPELVESLAEYGGRAATQRGANPQKAAAPKVLLYDIHAVQDNEAWLDVACHFMGERHKSLPGSGVMTLAGFLTLTFLAAVNPQLPGGTFIFHMRHPSGALSVAAYWEYDGTNYRVIATEFVTPVSIIIAGSVFIDGEPDSVQFTG